MKTVIDWRRKLLGFCGGKLGFSRKGREEEEVVENRIRVWQGWKGRPGLAVAEMASRGRRMEEARRKRWIWSAIDQREKEM